MKILYLIKKDIKIANGYWALSLFAIVVIILFFNNQSEVCLGSLYILLTAVSFSCYFFFSKVFSIEDKYKGNLYLLAIPYTRKEIVLAKYIIAVLIYCVSIMIYFILENIHVNNFALVKNELNISTLAVVFLETAVIISIFFPLYFAFSYEKIKILLMIVMIFLPTWGIAFFNYLIGNNIIWKTFNVNVYFNVLFFISSLIIMGISIKISVRVMDQKEHM